MVPRDSLRVAGSGPVAGRGSGVPEIFAAQRALLESATRRLKLLRSVMPGIKQMPQLGPTFGDTTGAGAAHHRAPARVPPASAHVRRLLRNKIAADPDSFFEQADELESDDLSWGKWEKSCQRFAGKEAEPDVLRRLFAEVAGGDSVKITRGRLTQVAQLYRAVRCFVDKAGCMDVLVDGLITSLVCKMRSGQPVQEVRGQQSAEGLAGKAASNVLQKLLASIGKHVCEDDTAVQDVAAALRGQAEIEKAQLAAQADAPPPAASDEDDATKSKHSDLPVSWLCAACAPHRLSLALRLGRAHARAWSVLPFRGEGKRSVGSNARGLDWGVRLVGTCR